MRFIRRPPKKYGSKRGIHQRKLEVIREQASQRENARKALEAVYVVSPGTACHVRRLGTKLWKYHRTRKEIRCCGFLWRNETHYGFVQGEFEVKIRVGLFHKE